MSWERYGGLRAAIAQLAAQIMYGEDVKQYFTAKWLAAKRLLGQGNSKSSRYRPQHVHVPDVFPIVARNVTDSCENRAVLAALRCSECTAPIRALPPAGQTAPCAYCGATLTAAAATGGRVEEHFALVLRVGPSNVDRVVRTLQEHLRSDPSELRARLEKPPVRVPIGPHAEHAHAVAAAASEAGAQVEIATYSVTIPYRTVTLENAGEKPLRVITVLRAEIELTVAEAKRVVGETPCVIATGVDDSVARALVAALEEAGATARAV